MITVRLRQRPDGGFGMTLRGHAGAGEYGQDLVCAGASALALAAARGAEELFRRGYLARRPRVRLGSGSITVIAVPGSRGRERTRQHFDTVYWGLEQLAELYPEHVAAERWN